VPAQIGPQPYVPDITGAMLNPIEFDSHRRDARSGIRKHPQFHEHRVAAEYRKICSVVVAVCAERPWLTRTERDRSRADNARYCDPNIRCHDHRS
jgi:hypothetical protein